MVYLGKSVLTNENIAIKDIDKSKMENKKSKKKVLQEIYILKKLKHPNIIQL